MAPKKKNEIVGWESPVAIHPGEFLQEALDDLKMSQADLADRVGLHKKVINEIIKGKNPITRATAFKLGKVFPMSAGYWANLQQGYEEDRARLEEEVRVASEVKDYLSDYKETYKELSLSGFLPNARWIEKNFVDIVSNLQRFFAVDSLGFVPARTMSVAFRKYERASVNSYTLASWLRLGRIKAQNTQVEKFNKKKLKDSLEEIKKLIEKKPEIYLIKLEKILADSGVVLAYMPYLKNTHVQAATMWVDTDKVLLMMNTTKKDEGKFWFNLFHELGHILLHKKNIFIDMDDEDVTTEEKQADKFAQKHLVPHMKEILVELDRCKGIEDDEKRKELNGKILKISKEHKISSAILAGRITHELRDENPDMYRFMSKFFEKKINHTNIA